MFAHVSNGSLERQKSADIFFRAQQLRESRRGRPGLPVPNSPDDLCGHVLRRKLWNWIHDNVASGQYTAFTSLALFKPSKLLCPLLFFHDWTVVIPSFLDVLITL